MGIRVGRGEGWGGEEGLGLGMGQRKAWGGDSGLIVNAMSYCLHSRGEAVQLGMCFLSVLAKRGAPLTIS